MTFNQEQALRQYNLLWDWYRVAPSEDAKIKYGPMKGQKIMSIIKVMDAMAKTAGLEFCWNGLDQQWQLAPPMEEMESRT